MSQNNRSSISIHKVSYKDEFYNLIPIKPEPYVWHATFKSYRDSIMVYGLLNNNGLVFANNQNFHISRFWRVMDSLCGSNSELDWVCSRLDFWRIDTRPNHFNWFYDPIIMDIECGGSEYRKHYICTPQSIDRSNLTCYQYDSAMHGKLYIKEFDGAACVNLKELPLRKVA